MTDEKSRDFSDKLLRFAGVVAVPLLVASIAAFASAVNAIAAHGARDAVVEQRVASVEDAVKAQAASAKRIEGTVTQLRVDQAAFVGGVEARIENLEGHHKPRNRRK